MSGSGGGGGGVVDTIVDCHELVLETQLTSPKEDVVERISEGDILTLELHLVSDRAVVVATYDGQVAGGVASGMLPQLRECIESGVRYHARVLLIRGGQVKVRIEPRQ